MDDWLKQIQSNLNTAMQETVDLLSEVSKQGDQAVGQMIDDSIKVMDDIEQAIAPSFRVFDNYIDQSLEAEFRFLDQHVVPWLEEVSAPVTRTINPLLQNHPACIGCRHYHGMSYGNDMMVCAMYPYGPDAETCSDWQSVWTDGKSEE